MGANYPNPFNGSTVIQYELNSSENISLRIFDVSGKIVKELVSGDTPSGIHHVEWDGTNSSGTKVSSGMYFYSLETETQSSFNKMLYLK